MYEVKFGVYETISAKLRSCGGGGRNLSGRVRSWWGHRDVRRTKQN